MHNNPFSSLSSPSSIYLAPFPSSSFHHSSHASLACTTLQQKQKSRRSFVNTTTTATLFSLLAASSTSIKLNLGKVQHSPSTLSHWLQPPPPPVQTWSRPNEARPFALLAVSPHSGPYEPLADAALLYTCGRGLPNQYCNAAVESSLPRSRLLVVVPWNQVCILVLWYVFLFLKSSPSFFNRRLTRVDSYSCIYPVATAAVLWNPARLYLQYIQPSPNPVSGDGEPAFTTTTTSRHTTPPLPLLSTQLAFVQRLILVCGWASCTSALCLLFRAFHPLSPPPLTRPRVHT